MEQETDHPAQASIEDVAPPVPKKYIQCELSTELLLAIIDQLPDFDSLISTVTTCKRVWETFLQHHRAVQGHLLRHGGQGILRSSEVTVAMKLPAMDNKAVGDVDDIIKTMRVFWGDEPGDSHRMRPYHATMALVRGTQSQVPTTSMPQHLQTLRQESVHLLFAPPCPRGLPSIWQPPVVVGPNSGGRWRIDRAASDLSLAQAREMAELGACAERLCTAYFAARARLGPQALNPDITARPAIVDGLWRFETFCRLLGGAGWWRRWRGSMSLPYVIGAFGQSRGRGAQDDQFEAVHDFLRRGVKEKWLAATEGMARCRCPGGSEYRPGFCYRCYNDCVDGALCRGLGAVCRILETPVGDMRALKECFVWEADGLTSEHPVFLRYFYNIWSLRRALIAP